MKKFFTIFATILSIIILFPLVIFSIQYGYDELFKKGFFEEKFVKNEDLLASSEKDFLVAKVDIKEVIDKPQEKLPDIADTPPVTTPKLEEKPLENIKKIYIHSGDTFSKLAYDAFHLDKNEVKEILQDKNVVHILSNLKIGQYFEVTFKQEKAIKISFDYEKDKKIDIIKEGKKYTVSYTLSPILEQAIQTQTCGDPIVGEIIIAPGSSLTSSGNKAGFGIHAREIYDIFKNHTVNLNRLYANDRIRFIYTCKDNPNTVNKIIAVELLSNNKFYYVFLYKDNKYYTKEGVELGKRSRLFIVPVDNPRVTSPFGYRIHPIYKTRKLHRGIDYGAKTGTPIYAAADGKVIDRRYMGSAGNTIIIQHTKKYKTYYMHMNGFASNIKKGSYVSQGQLIGYIGATGNVTGPHLHFEIRVNEVAKNPVNYLSAYKDYSIAKDSQADFEQYIDKWKAYFNAVEVAQLDR